MEKAKLDPTIQVDKCRGAHRKRMKVANIMCDHVCHTIYSTHKSNNHICAFDITSAQLHKSQHGNCH